MKKTKLVGLHSAKIILYSVDLDEIEKCQSCGNWEKSAFILGEAAKKLKMSGVDFILVCTNTMHKVYMQIQSMIKIPVIHIADATASELKKEKLSMPDFLEQRTSAHISSARPAATTTGR